MYGRQSAASRALNAYSLQPYFRQRTFSVFQTRKPSKKDYYIYIYCLVCGIQRKSTKAYRCQFVCFAEIDKILQVPSFQGLSSLNIPQNKQNTYYVAFTQMVFLQLQYLSLFSHTLRYIVRGGPAPRLYSNRLLATGHTMYNIV